jgi:hypothetical protein
VRTLERVDRLLRPPEVLEKTMHARRQVFNTQSAKGAGKDNTRKDNTRKDNRGNSSIHHRRRPGVCAQKKKTRKSIECR